MRRRIKQLLLKPVWRLVDWLRGYRKWAQQINHACDQIDVVYGRELNVYKARTTDL